MLKNQINNNNFFESAYKITSVSESNKNFQFFILAHEDDHNKQSDHFEFKNF